MSDDNTPDSKVEQFMDLVKSPSSPPSPDHELVDNVVIIHGVLEPGGILRRVIQLNKVWKTKDAPAEGHHDMPDGEVTPDEAVSEIQSVIDQTPEIAENIVDDESAMGIYGPETVASEDGSEVQEVMGLLQTFNARAEYSPPYAIPVLPVHFHLGPVDMSQAGKSDTNAAEESGQEAGESDDFLQRILGNVDIDLNQPEGPSGPAPA